MSKILSSSLDMQEKASKYLIKYGYIDNSGGDGKYEKLSSFSDAVAKFQESTGLSVTGRVDKETQKLMDTPRCGMKDVVTSGNKFQNYKTDGKWNKKILTYNIFSYGQSLTYSIGRYFF